jgi:hypothetical protein
MVCHKHGPQKNKCGDPTMHDGGSRLTCRDVESDSGRLRPFVKSGPCNRYTLDTASRLDAPHLAFGRRFFRFRKIA